MYARYLCAASLAILLLNIALPAQQTGNSPNKTDTSTATGTTPAPVQDPMAISILNQALTVGGGAQAIGAIGDYTATGNIIYNPEQPSPLQGTVTVTGFNGIDFRIDSVLPGGTRSYAVYQGIVSSKTESGKIASFVPKAILPTSNALPYATPLFPAGTVFSVSPLNAIINSQGFNLAYNGITQIDGHSVHNIVVQRFIPGAAQASTDTLSGRGRELFIDSTSLQIVAIREKITRNGLHEIHYADYRAVNGVLMPFAISENVAGATYIHGSTTWAIQLNQVTFNTGLKETAFQIQ